MTPRRRAETKAAHTTDVVRTSRDDVGESVYRGRRITVSRDAKPLSKGAPCCLHLFIDGQEIAIEETPTGVMSNQNIFAEYGSAFELAEDLIRQWGQADIRQVVGHSHGGHDHGDNHDHNHEHNHDHDRDH
ncbi:MAG: hypothetical protein M3373_07950 [Gemmatimonadota bacterium]|nr:hypothetical protein [Gemmatimonadota bacterium]